MTAKTKVYLVRYGEYSDQGIAGVFSTKEKAERFCKIKNKVESSWCGDFWVSDYTLDEYEYPKDTKVVKYYSISIELLDGQFIKAGELYNADEDYEIFTEPVVIEKGDSWISVSSTISMKHAKKVAIEQYQIYTQQKLEEEIMENK